MSKKGYENTKAESNFNAGGDRWKAEATLTTFPGQRDRVAKNEVTGDRIASEPSTQAYRDGWDRIFGKEAQERKKREETRQKVLKHIEDIKNDVAKIEERVRNGETLEDILRAWSEIKKVV